MACLSLVPATAAAQNRGLLPTDFYNEIGVGEVAISPDGALVAFTVTTVDEDDKPAAPSSLDAGATWRAA